MRHNGFITVNETVQLQFFQDALLHRFFTVLCRDHRILYPVIKDPGRHDLFPRMPLFFHMDRRVQIYRKLHLKPVIQRRNIKALHSGLIICHLHIHTVLFFARIDPVDLPAPELQLIPAGHKVSLLKLLRKRPHRPPDQPLDPPDHIFVPRGAEKHGISVINHALFHTFSDQLFPFLLCHLHPA